MPRILFFKKKVNDFIGKLLKIFAMSFSVISAVKMSTFIIYYFRCVGSSFPCKGFLQLRRAGATLHRGAQASYRRGLSRCGAQAPDAQAQ